MVAVAQLVEPRVVVPDVEGSSPFGHPKPSNARAAAKGLGDLGLIGADWSSNYPDFSKIAAGYVAAGYGVALGAGEAAAGGV